MRSRADLTLRCASGSALVGVWSLWWAPSTLLAVAPALDLNWGIGHRLRRATRLVDTGSRGEALRVYAAVRRDIGADLRRARGRRGAP